jgi:hypothetical protein
LAQASVLVGLHQAHGSCVGQIDVVHHVHTSIRKGSQKIRDQAVRAGKTHQPVDGAAAAKDAAAAPLIRPVQPRRIGLAVVEPGVAGPVLDEDLGAWHREQRRAVLASRLDQQHAGGGILAQPRSHGAAR